MRTLCIKRVGLTLVLGLSILHSNSQRTVPTAYGSNAKINYVRTWDASAPEQDANTIIGRPLKDARQTTQYLDGLGRPLQTVVKQGSLATGTNPTELVNPVEYDSLGREPFQYLPYAETSASDGLFKTDPFGSQKIFMQSQYGSQSETWFYGQTNFEPSPLNRVQENFAAGNSWVGTSGL